MTANKYKRKFQKLRDSARGEECTLRIHPYCNGNPETVVLCHINKGGVGGMGMKPPDLCGVFACSGCHDAIDGRSKTEYTPVQLDSYIMHGILRTLVIVDKAYKLTKK